MTRYVAYLDENKAFGKYLPRVYTDKVTLMGNLVTNNKLSVDVKLIIKDRVDEFGNALISDNLYNDFFNDGWGCT